MSRDEYFAFANPSTVNSSSNCSPGPPRIALTLGDVAGIGPEVVARACSTAEGVGWCVPVVVGHPEVLRQALRLVGSPLPVVEVADCRSAAAVPYPQALACWNPSSIAAQEIPRGRNDARAGRAAYDYLVGAARAARAGEVQAITTAPLSKAALHLAGLDYPGHTEILAEFCGVSDFAMMLHIPARAEDRHPYGLSVVHVTLHTSLRSVPDLLTTAGVSEKIALVSRFTQALGCARPRVGVCALNPHAGENGLFGDEEARIIVPAVEAQRAAGVQVSGPWPADTLLQRAVGGEFDAVVAMYHDQGHIALKLLGFQNAVNVTLGLPLVRTSPSHGTAFDIAGQGEADPAAMLTAMQVAAKLSRNWRVVGGNA